MEAIESIGVLKAEGGGGKKKEVKIREELELPWIKTTVGICLVESGCGGGDRGKEVITSIVP